MKKRLLSALLALSVLLGSMPVYALEDTTPATPDPATVSTTETAADDDEDASAVQELEGRVFSEDFSNADIPDSEELFALYVQEQLYPGNQPSTLANWGEQSGVLNETGLKVYRALKDFFGQVARGEWESTANFRISMPMTVTYSELGVSGADDPKFEEAAGDKLNEQAQISQAIDYLLEDCPAELYWFDKTTSITWDFYDGTEISGGIRVEGFEITIPIVEAYCTDSIYSANQDKMQEAFETAQKAQSIAEKYADLPSAYDKLVAFRDEISALTDYNFEAVEEPTPYGDPWQLIYVFDGDPETKVVCEGYAKAFQYLCDLAGIPCYTVTGEMSSKDVSGAHMWNVVPMDGQNYLVDVTNYDQVDVVLPELFMAGASGSVAQGYNITLSNSPGTVTYQYDSFTIGLYGENALELAPDNYVPSEPELSITGLPETVAYGDTFSLQAAYADGPVNWSAAGAARVDVSTGQVTVTDVGDFTITAKVGDQEKTVSGQAMPRALTVTTANVEGKPYDGTTEVPVTSITLSNVVSGDLVFINLNAVTAMVSSANAGTYDTVTLSNLQLTGDDAGMYTIASSCVVAGTVTISKASSDLTVEPQAATGLTYTGQPQALVTEGTAEGGTLQYALSENGPYSEELPTATDAGDYTVWYKVAGDGNHTDIAAAQLGTVTIAKAVPQAPQNLTTTYSHGAILSSVNLPDGWEWVNPNELLGDWGQREFMAKHPGDGNYVPNEVTVEVYIKFADCSLGDVRVDDSMLTYNGAWQRLTGIQLSLEGYVLQQGIDYTVEDSGGIEAGSYVATLQGKGNYRGMIKYQYYILPKPVMAQVVAEDKVYDGTTDAVVSAEVETGVAGEKLTITGLKGTFAQADAGENLTVTVDSSQASWGNNNYEVTFPETATGSILPADYTYSGVADQTVKIGNGLDTVNLVTTAAGVADETVQGAVTWYRDKACTQPLPEDYLFSGQEGTVVTLYWKFTPDAAYTNYTSVPQTGSTAFTLTPKATPKVSAQGLTKTYDGKAVTLEDLNPTADVPGSWALDVSTPELKNAGDYKVLLRFTPDNSRDYVTTSILVPVKVEPRLFTLGLELSSNQITTGEELPTARLVWSGALEGEDMTPEGEAAFTGWPESGKAGYYAIQWANCQEMLQALMDKPAAVNYRFQIRESAQLTVTEAALLPGSDETYRLESQEGLSEVPEAVQQAGFPTEEAVLDEMFQYAARQLTGATQENTVLHDVRLYYSPDGGKTWEKATEENFPAEGITVTLPYPDGTNAADFDFVVTHMLTVGEKAGQVETPAVTKTDKGIQFTVHSLSPIAISWKVAPKNIMSEEQTITREPISANSSGSISYYTCPACGYHDWTATDEGYRCDECGYLESMKQLSGYGNVKGTYEPKSSGAAAAAAETIPQTGDESEPVLWAVLMFASALTLGGLMVSRRKHNR